MTSLPILSKTNTFHIGSPSSFSRGVLCWFVPSVSSVSEGSWLRLSIRSIEAEARQLGWLSTAGETLTNLAVSKGLTLGSHLDFGFPGLT